MELLLYTPWSHHHATWHGTVRRNPSWSPTRPIRDDAAMRSANPLVPGGGRTLWIASKGFRLRFHSPFQDFSCRKGNMTESPATTPIPVQLSEPDFIAFIFPHLSMPRRGPRCKLGYHRVFNLILWVLYTGMQWKCLPVPRTSDGKSGIHYTTIYKAFAKWCDDGSLEQAFVASSLLIMGSNETPLLGKPVLPTSSCFLVRLTGGRFF